MQIVDIVVAVRNEEDNIAPFVEAVRSLALPEGIDLKMLFVEDGSRDRTAEIAAEAGARVIHHRSPMGVGAAFLWRFPIDARRQRALRATLDQRARNA